MPEKCQNLFFVCLKKESKNCNFLQKNLSFENELLYFSRVCRFSLSRLFATGFWRNYLFLKNRLINPFYG
jgi:hypothetical protein